MAQLRSLLRAQLLDGVGACGRDDDGGLVNPNPNANPNADANPNPNPNPNQVARGVCRGWS